MMFFFFSIGNVHGFLAEGMEIKLTKSCTFPLLALNKCCTFRAIQSILSNFQTTVRQPGESTAELCYS